MNGYNNEAWFVGQAVKTPPSHGGNRGSIPLRTVLEEIFEKSKVSFFCLSIIIVYRKSRFVASKNTKTFLFGI